MTESCGFKSSRRDLVSSQPDLDVGHWRQGLLAVGVLGGERQQRGHPQRHAGRHRLGLDPEAEHPRCHHHPQYHHHHHLYLIHDIITIRQVGMYVWNMKYLRQHRYIEGQ